MPKLIVDQFTGMPISRQRRYQMRRQQEGCCKICGGPVERKQRGKKRQLLCLVHMRAATEHMRVKRSPAFDLI